MSSQIDTSELDQLARRIGKQHWCPISEILEQLNAEDRRLFEEGTSHPDKYSPGVLAAFLTARGHEVSVNKVTSHRKGTCSCVRA